MTHTTAARSLGGLPSPLPSRGRPQQEPLARKAAEEAAVLPTVPQLSLTAVCGVPRPDGALRSLLGRTLRTP